MMQRGPTGRMSTGGPARLMPMTVERSEGSEAEDPPPPSTTKGVPAASVADDELEERFNETAPPTNGDVQRRRSFYCTKHGLVCDKVKKMNVQAERNPGAVLARQTSGVKPKYYCRKHGLSCAKVKKMNEEHERNNGNSQPTTPKMVSQLSHCSSGADDDHEDDIGPAMNGTVDVEKKADPSPVKHSSAMSFSSTVVVVESKMEEQPDPTPPPTKRGRGRPPKSANRQELKTATTPAGLVASAAESTTPSDVPKRRGRPPKSAQGPKTTPPQRIVCTRLWARTTRSGARMPPVHSAPVKSKKLTPRRSNRRASMSNACPLTSPTPKRHVGRQRKSVPPPVVEKTHETAHTSATTAGPSKSQPPMDIARPHSVAAMADDRSKRRSYRQLTVDTGAFSSLLQSNISPRLLARSDSNGLNKRKCAAKSGANEPTAKKSRFWGFLSNIIGTK